MVMDDIYRQGYRESARRARKQALIGGAANFIGGALAGYLQNRKREQQNQAMLSFLDQLNSGSGGGIAGAAGGAVSGQPNVLAALQANPRVLSTPMGQSAMSAYLQNAMTPQIELPGLGRVPYSSAALGYLGDMRSAEAAEARLAQEMGLAREQLNFKREDSKADRDLQRELQEREINADAEQLALSGLNRLHEVKAKARADEAKFNRDAELRTNLQSMGHIQRMTQIGAQGDAALEVAKVRAGGSQPLTPEAQGALRAFLAERGIQMGDQAAGALGLMGQEDPGDLVKGVLLKGQDPRMQRAGLLSNIIQRLSDLKVKEGIEGERTLTPDEIGTRASALVDTVYPRKPLPQDVLQGAPADPTERRKYLAELEDQGFDTTPLR